MTTNFKPVLDLIGNVYEAAIDPACWPVAVEQLADITRSKSAVLVVHDSEMKQLRFLYSHGIPKPLQRFLNSPLGMLDPALKIMRTQPQGKALNMYRLDDSEQVPRMVHAVLSRVTDLFYFGGVNCFNNETWHAGIGLHRTRDVGEFEPETLALLEDLVPHFQRALRIQREFLRLRLSRRMFRAELDRHIIGLALLNDDCEPIYMNPMAEQTLQRHGALMLRGDRIRAFNREEDEQLQQAIDAAIGTRPETVNAGQALRLNHPDHDQPLAILVVPSEGGNIDPDPTEKSARVAVYITDPDTTIPISDDALIEAYGLTVREARVAVALANGRDVTEIAEMHHVSPQTVRTQLKSIFTKTGVNRQVDLIRLLLSGPFSFNG